LSIPADVPVLVFAGRICEQKRPAMLAEIFKAVQDHGLDFRALVIGDGELREKLEALLDQYRLTANVQMLGTVSHQRWLEILTASDILLMPSQYEGISIALLEAMAAGVVPVVAKVGGQDEIVNPEAGILVSHGTNEVQEYLAAVRRLLSSPEELPRMSKACRALAASKLSWGRMIDNFAALLDEAHQLKSSQPRSTVSPGLGLELAAQALECKRLDEALATSWNARAQPLTDGPASTTTLAGAHAVAVLFSQTWLGRMIVRQPILRKLGKKILVSVFRDRKTGANRKTKTV
jgi:hypothetical protein